MSHSAKSREQMLEAEIDVLRVRLASLRLHDSGLSAETLCTSHQRLQLVSLAATDAVWDWDLATNEIWWTEGIRALFGYTIEEAARGFSWWLERIHPQDRDATRTGLQSAIAGKALHWMAEYRFGRADGSYAHVCDRAFILRDEHGKALRMVGAMVDESAQQQARDASLQNLTLLRAVEGTADGIWVKDRDGRYLMINAAGARLVHKTPGEILGRITADLFPPDIARQIRADDLRVMAEGTTLYSEYTLPEKGLPRTLLTTRSPFKDETGQIIGVMGISHDITHRKLAEEALRHSEEKFRLLVETTKEWIWACDEQGKITFSNPAIETILGYSVAEIVGKPGTGLVHESEREATKRNLPRCKREKHGWTNWVVHCLHKDGSSRYLEDNGTPILDAAGQVVGFRGVARDVTERRQLEEKLRHAQKLESIGRLAGGVAHEFNNLLTVILGYSALASQALGHQDPGRSHLEAITKAGRRAAALTAQLLAFSQQRLFAPRAFDLNAVVGRARTMLLAFLGNDIELSTMLASNLPPVKADPDQIEETLITLVLNARDALPQGGRILIETSSANLGPGHRQAHPVRPGAYGVLAVHDTGRGMDATALAHVFEPFYTTKEVGKGTGLGLAAVYGLVLQNGGHIEVQSRPGEGSTFRIFLPVANGEPPLVAELSAAPSPEVLRLLGQEAPG